MCKLAMIPYLKPSKSALAWSFARAITKPMCAADHDGYGYAAVGTDGAIGVERWLAGSNAWQHSARTMPAMLSAIVSGAIDNPPTIRDTSGPMLRDKEITALLLHSRYATSAVGLQNNHPHCSYDARDNVRTALVHNGVVQVNAKRLRYSTCDSETILVGFDKHGVTSAADAWQAAADDLSGYYALGIAHRSAGVTHVDIVRDSSAALSVCWVAELDAPVIATAPEHVKQACKRLSWHAPIVAPFRTDTHVRFNPATRTMVYSAQFKPSARWLGSGSGWGEGVDTGRWYKSSDGHYRQLPGEGGTLVSKGAYLSSEVEEVQQVLSMMGARGKK